MENNIAAIRQDYTLKTLSKNDVNANPFLQFEIWWKEGLAADIKEINAMTLATTDSQNLPNARIVLLKDFSDNGFTFFTNYDSAKANELAHNKNVCLLFFWKELERQIRIKGIASKISEAESIKYFDTRPLASKIAAWASLQSNKINNRAFLEMQYKKYETAFGNDIPKPPHWGGYIVKPVYIEFWQGRRSRLHDRIAYTKNENDWLIERLSP